MLVILRDQRVKVPCFLSNIFQSHCGIKKNKKQSMTACAYCCIVEEYSSNKKQHGETCRGVNEDLLSTRKW